MVLYHSHVAATSLITAKELLVPRKANVSFLSSMHLDEVSDVMRLNDFHEEDGNHVTRMIEKALMVLLNLKDLN